MAISFIRDDNGVPLHDPSGLRPVFAASGQAEITSTGSIAETSIAALNVAANRVANGCLIVRLVALSNPIQFSFGAASAAPADTTTMAIIPANGVIEMKLLSTDVSCYVKQITGAGTLKISVLV